MVAAGQLSNRITIEEAADAKDAAYQTIRTWSTRANNLPAKVESVTGGETIRGRQVSASATILFTIRYMAGLTSKMRVKFGSRTLGIVRVSDPYGDRRELRIECKE